MRLISTERQSAVVATSADINYPADNLLDGNPKKKWRAVDGVNTATLTVTLDAGGSDSLLLAYTNAESATVTIKDAAETETYATDTFDLTPLGRVYNRLWMGWDEEAGELHAIIELVASAGITLEAGIVRGGHAVSLPNPKYGLGLSRKDYSVRQEMSSGGLYIHDRDRPREHSLSLLMTHAEAEDMDEVYTDYGANPLAILVLDDIDDMRWCGFFRMIDEPRAAYDHHGHSSISMTIREVI